MKLEKSSLLHRCHKNICEYCEIVHSFFLSFLKFLENTPLGLSEIVRFSVNHREAIVAKLVLSLTRLSLPLVRFRHNGQWQEPMHHPERTSTLYP